MRGLRGAAAPSVAFSTMTWPLPELLLRFKFDGNKYSWRQKTFEGTAGEAQISDLGSLIKLDPVGFIESRENMQLPNHRWHSSDV